MPRKENYSKTKGMRLHFNLALNICDTNVIDEIQSVLNLASSRILDQIRDDVVLKLRDREEKLHTVRTKHIEAFGKNRTNDVLGVIRKDCFRHVEKKKAVLQKKLEWLISESKLDSFKTPESQQAGSKYRSYDIPQTKTGRTA